MVPQSIPTWLTDIMTRVSNVQLPGCPIFGGMAANHCLLNEYEPGVGIMAHEDGPLYYPTIATLSLGSHAVLRLNSKQTSPVDMLADGTGLYVEKNSLLIIRDSMYTVLHGIDDIAEDVNDGTIVNIPPALAEQHVFPRTTRLSLTIRHVPKVANPKLFKFLQKKK